MRGWTREARAIKQGNQTSIRGFLNGFQDLLAIELKNPNGTGTLSDKQQETHKHLKEQCDLDTRVGCV